MADSDSSTPPDRVRRRWWRWAFVVVALFAFAGVLAALSDGSRTVDSIAVATGGLAAVLGVSAVFYEIGAGEDRARAAERRSPPTG